MKKIYVSPELDIIEFDFADIISNSNGTGNGEWELFTVYGDEE